MKRWVLILLIGLNLALIWGSSCMPGEDSAAVSGGVLELIAGFIPVLNSQWAHTLLRKLAHFSEFACLGVLMAQLCRQELGQVPVWLAGVGLAVGCVDETIQIFSPGRSSSVLDVWIDSAGFIAGMVLIGIVLRRKRHD